MTRIGEYLPPATGDDPQAIATTLRPEIPAAEAQNNSIECESEALRTLGVETALIASAADRALLHHTTIEQELLAADLGECEYYRVIARSLRLPFIESIGDGAVADSVLLDSQLRSPTMLRLTYPRLPPTTVIVPQARRLSDLNRLLVRLPSLRGSIAITAPATVRRAVWAAGAARRVRDTVNALFEEQPRFSARIVFQGNQGFYAGVLVTLLVLFLVAVPAGMLVAHLALSFLYLAALMFRAHAVMLRRRPRPPIVPQPQGKLPVYTVMVALYREAGLAAQLVTALKRLNWPTALLDIKLICEADDPETIEALTAQALGPQFEIIEVPAMRPRTKPKALSYALAGARGSYLAVYDAEDRPHPDQLREAHARFANAPQRLACLQAPLVISNGGQSWLSALFALEYAALFRALLPMLARRRMPLPLGGTSNHFRTDVLRAVGGWDPFNVTEDADLGMRLYRLGFHSDVIERQTVEDAPTGVRIWVRQRTRWFKGWMQTWLVMMRDPRALYREMGLGAFCVFHLLIGGMLISSLAHPLVLSCLVHAFAALLATPAKDMSMTEQILLVIDSINIVGSYAVFLLLGRAAMIDRERKRIGWRFVTVPLYWMLVTFAAWRAIFELRSNPFLWAKTPHEPSEPSTPARPVGRDRDRGKTRSP